jgi:hypothetical protein
MLHVCVFSDTYIEKCNYYSTANVKIEIALFPNDWCHSLCYHNQYIHCGDCSVLGQVQYPSLFSVKADRPFAVDARLIQCSANKKKCVFAPADAQMLCGVWSRERAPRESWEQLLLRLMKSFSAFNWKITRFICSKVLMQMKKFAPRKMDIIVINLLQKSLL